MSEWQGWALGESALFFQPVDESPDSPIALYLQYRERTAMVATFVSGDLAQYTQDFLEVAITNVGRANSALLEKLDG